MTRQLRQRPALSRRQRRVSWSAPTLFRAPGWDWVQAGDVGWWVRPEWCSALIGPNGLRLDEWREQDRLATVKTGPHRVVYRADLPEGVIFIKHFRVPSWRETLRQWFRRGKARNEAKRAARLNAIAIPTITPIALGEQRKRKFLFENYLVTPAIAGTMPLDDFVERRLGEMPTPRQTRIRRRLAVAMGRLTARIHEAGLIHQDFHPGNLLVGLDADDRPHLALIDLDALRVRHRLGWRDAQANLALLNHYFWCRCGPSDRHRFFRAYLDGRTGSPPDPAAFARGIETATRSWAERLWRRWGRRCQGSNKYFKFYRGRRAWAVASRDVDQATIRVLLRDLDAPFRQPGTVLLKDSRTTTVAEVQLSVSNRPTAVIYKRFNRKKWLDPILTLFRPSRAWRAWQAGQHLASRAIPTPQNLAILVRKAQGPRWLPHHFWPHDTYLVTIKAEPSVTLSDYVHQVLPTLEPGERRARLRRLTIAMGRLLRLMHERSLSHRDLKAANVLIVGDPAAEEVRLSLIDLVGIHLEHPLPRGRRVQNLARLQISLAGGPGWSRTDALRFLHAYLPRAHTPRAEWKAFWREAEKRCREKEAQNQRRGRILS